MTEMGPKSLPGPADFFECPIWRYDDLDDLYHPVLTPEAIPDMEHDLSIRALFTAPSGQKLDGYVVGITRIFSVGLFGEKEIFHANKNLRDLSEEWLRKFMKDRPDLGLTSVRQIFPLRYVTQIDRPGYQDFSGTFDLYAE